MLKTRLQKVSSGLDEMGSSLDGLQERIARMRTLLSGGKLPSMASYEANMNIQQQTAPPNPLTTFRNEVDRKCQGMLNAYNFFRRDGQKGVVPLTCFRKRAEELGISSTETDEALKTATRSAKGETVDVWAFLGLGKGNRRRRKSHSQSGSGSGDRGGRQGHYDPEEGEGHVGGGEWSTDSQDEGERRRIARQDSSGSCQSPKSTRILQRQADAMAAQSSVKALKTKGGRGREANANVSENTNRMKRENGDAPQSTQLDTPPWETAPVHVDAGGEGEEALAATKLTAHWKGKKVRDEFSRQKQEREEAATKLSANWKGKKAREEYTREKAEREQAATKLSAGWKGKKVREEYEKEKKEREEAATKLSAGWKGKKVREEYEKEKKEREEAATKLSAGWKGKKVGEEYEKEKKEREEAATKLSANWKGKKAREDYSREKQEREEAATKLSAHWKGRKTRKEISVRSQTEETGGMNATDHHQERPGRERDSGDQAESNKEHSAATTLSAHWKGKQARADFKKQKKEREDAATKLSANWKGRQARQEFHEKKKEKEKHQETEEEEKESPENQTPTSSKRRSRGEIKVSLSPTDKNFLREQTGGGSPSTVTFFYSSTRELADADRAATKLSAHWKGKQTRSSFKKSYSAQDTRSKGHEGPAESPTAGRGDQTSGSSGRSLPLPRDRDRDGPRESSPSSSSAREKNKNFLREQTGGGSPSTVTFFYSSTKDLAEADRAATTLSAHWKGKVARGEVKRVQDEIGKEKEQQAAAATTLSAAWKGKQAREEVKKMKEEQKTGEGDETDKEKDKERKAKKKKKKEKKAKTEKSNKKDRGESDDREAPRSPHLGT
uniref:Uncharacterized protein n=1 Tax=Chromera velia CCMP2878 TaxID=1169474 RepID=A0A0G4HPF2_9ALVE|eukprot:Cvel_7833.t1-p1 / transcript=Cvel_7833.t1 / gene=Cvel_7833 / organism=Chromera_velia_CCMP2878 / gene_product=hypothetical protein / transcript_product=hypothetical protein / location=Cvel_scaffold418:73275-77047(-) / protein_length=843 / sequence_SO=supercontig / SO=protein_coding / is_pseudo=false